MKIEGYAEELADFFALECFSSVYFKLKIERVSDNDTNDDASTVEMFPSNPRINEFAKRIEVT